MALTPSNMLPLGTKAPYFSLTDTISNKTVTLNDLRGKFGIVVMFISNHCPFVKHINHEISNLAKDYISKGFGFVAISSNDISNYPDDRPELMKENAVTNDFRFPYLFDETQEIAKAYDAACTPDFYVFDKDLILVYRGQLDDSRPGNKIPVTGKDIRGVLNAIINKDIIPNNQKPSIGCNIKWKK